MFTKLKFQEYRVKEKCITPLNLKYLIRFYYVFIFKHFWNAQ